MSNDQTQEPQGIGVSYVLYRLTEEHREAIVQRALAQGNALSAATRNRLRTIVGPLRLDGFRPGKAPLHRYKDFFLIAGHREDTFADPLLRAWMEAQPQLAQGVSEFLQERSLLGEGDAFDTEIATFRRSPEWETAMEELAGRYPNDSEDDLRLMACLVKGALDIDERDDAELEPAAKGVPLVFEQALRALGREAPGSRLWEYAVNDFLRDVQNLLKEQQAIAAAAAELVQVEQEVINRHGDLLRYFGSDLEEKADGTRLIWKDMTEGAAALRKLHGLLDEYAAVREPGADRAEEADRRGRRDALEAQVDAALTELQALEATPEDVEAAQAAEAEPAPSPEEVEALRAEVSGLQEQIEGLQAQRDAIVTERDGLAAERDALTSERDALAERVQGLEDDIEESRTLAETWRISYQASQQSQAEEDAPSRPVAESVEHAMELAEDRFREQITFSLNAKSDAAIPFDKPQQVYDALEWLATEFYSARCGESSVPDLDFSLKQVCGWRYTPVQSVTTMGMYREYYETTVNGRKRKLEEHIGTGNGYPRGTIRVAFFWDAERRRVVIGYIGRHQRTRAT